MEVGSGGNGGGPGGAGSAAGQSGGGDKSAGTSGAAGAGAAAAPQASPVGGGAGTSSGPGAAPAAYTPNFKYKATTPQGDAASRLEKELPEWARPFVTSQDLEKNFREVFEKSDGIDAVKQHRDQLVQENKTMREQWAPYIQNVQQVVGHLQKGDLDSFFEALNVPEATILKYALYRLQLRENPEQLQSHNQLRQLTLQNQQLQQQVQQYTGGYQDLVTQQYTMQLDHTLARPEIQAAVQAFDSRAGTPGAFRAAVIRRGQAYEANGKKVGVEQVLTEELEFAQKLLAAGGGVAAGPAGVGAAGPATPQSEKPTFPNVRGKGTSPAKKGITSTDQLRELARQRA